MLCQIFSLRHRTLSRVRAFESAGVSLKFPLRSRSGVRAEDGMVVFAMPAAQVRADDWGFSCLLWAPRDAAADLPCHLERLRHCRLAVLRSAAEGFLLYGEGEARRGEVLSLRVARAGEEYWARWGDAARTKLPRTVSSQAGAFALG